MARLATRPKHHWLDQTITTFFFFLLLSFSFIKINGEQKHLSPSKRLRMHSCADARSWWSLVGRPGALPWARLRASPTRSHVTTKTRPLLTRRRMQRWSSQQRFKVNPWVAAKSPRGPPETPRRRRRMRTAASGWPWPSSASMFCLRRALPKGKV